MFDMIFALIALSAGGSSASSPEVAAQVIAPAGLVAEDQTPSGKFTTATEVRPILQVTKANWIGVREYGGNDLLYLTHLWSWRCGLLSISVAINDGPYTEQPLPACHMDFATPNAILPDDGLPYSVHPLGSIARVGVRVTYDDLLVEEASFDRAQVRIP